MNFAKKEYKRQALLLIRLKKAIQDKLTNLLKLTPDSSETLNEEVTPVEDAITTQPKKNKLKVKDPLANVGRGDTVIYQEPGSEEWNKVTLVKRGYTARSANKN